jgi:lipopolysaccharide export system permease protein
MIRVPGVGNAFQKTQNDSYKGEREMSVCEMQRNAVTAHKQFVAARKEYLQDVAIAKKRKVQLTKETLTVKTKEPVTVGVGRVYCNFLSQLGVKELLAEETLNQNPVRQDTGVKVRVDTSKVPTPETLNVDSLRTFYNKNQTGKPRLIPNSGLVLPPPGIRGNRPPELKPPAAPSSGMPATATNPVPTMTQVRGDTVPPGGGMAMPNEVIPGQVESARLRLMDALRSLNLYEVEIQKKFALAAACFIFVLLGAPIALRFPRGGVGLTIGVSLVVFGLYYVGLIAGESLARRGMVPPVVSMWIANVIFGTIALILLARMGRESGSSRGGDFSEMVDTIRHKLLRRPAKSGRRHVTPSVKS